MRTEKTLEEANDEISREFRKEDNRFVADITGRTWHGWMPKAFWNAYLGTSGSLCSTKYTSTWSIV